MASNRTVSLRAIVLVVTLVAVAVAVTPASAEVPRSAASGLVLYEGLPGFGDVYTNPDSLSPTDPLYDLWAVDPAGGVAVNLTNAPGVDTGAAWSPDGKRIAFASNRDDNYNIYVMNADGTGVKRLTGGSLSSLTPLWSPDGRWIAFARGAEIHMMRPDGSSKRMVYRSHSGWMPISLGDWSPDGRTLLFDLEGSENSYDIWSLDVAARRASRLIATPVSEYGPDFSPNGRNIAFTRETMCARLMSITGLCVFDVFVSDRQGRATENITDTANISEETPSWSPDGTQIAFTGDPGILRLEMDIWVMELETGIRRPLTVQPRTWDYAPDWQPVAD